MHDGNYNVQIYLQTPSSEHALGVLRNVGFCPDEGVPRNFDNPFVRAAARTERQFTGQDMSNVHADDGEVAVFEFENIRAALERRGLRSVGVRVGAKASNNHALHVPIVTSTVKTHFA